MRVHAEDPAALAGFKDQASKLRTFLASAGFELKHTHALEAIAAIHGYPNYHLLQNAAAKAVLPWLISTFGDGVLPRNYTALGFADGIAVFCHQLARVAARESVELQVRAQLRGEHQGLYALNYGAVVVALTCPRCPRVQQRDPSVIGFEALTLQEIADAIGDALYERAGWKAFQERVEDEGFQATLESRVEDEALRGATPIPDAFGPDERAVLATRYLMDVRFKAGAEPGKEQLR